MAITNSNIITYIFTNRLTVEDQEYLLEGNTTKGADAVNSALLWVHARFRKAGYEDMFKDWKDYLYGFSSSALTSMQTMENAFYGADTDLYLDYMMMFESLILFTIYNLYSRPEQELTAMDKKDKAQEIIEGLLGSSAFPGEGAATGSKTPIVAVVESSTDDEKEDEAFGMRAGYRRTTSDGT